MCVVVWAISVPENNLKYATFSGKYKSHKKKINKLISTVRTETKLMPSSNLCEVIINYNYAVIILTPLKFFSTFDVKEQ